MPRKTAQRVAQRPAGPSEFLPAPGQPIEEHHLVAAVRELAYVVVTYGEKYAPLLDRMERELADLRRRQKPVDHARRILEAYTLEGGVRAIS